jgi:MFS family permease
VSAGAAAPPRPASPPRRTFAALAHPNYRRYLAGQAVSMVGTWMHSVAQPWLVLQMTGSATAVGLVAGLRFLPVLILAPYAGVVADRLDKRRLLVLTQSAMGASALTLGLLVVTGAVRLWMVFAVAALMGVANGFDSPARQAFVSEMVGGEDLRNAVSLNSVTANAARVAGPAVAGVLIATVGVGACFLVNAVSYLAVVWAFLGMDPDRLRRPTPAPRRSGQIREGLAHVRRTPNLAVPLAMMALMGTLTYEFQVALPVLGRGAFGAGPAGYGAMTAAMGAGAVAGGLVVAGRSGGGLGRLSAAAAALGVTVLVAAAAPSLGLEIAALVAVGVCSIAVLAMTNTTIQLAAAPAMRGRVMALWAVTTMGSTPVGGPTVGWVGENGGPRLGLAIGGFAALAAAGIGLAGRARAAASARSGRKPAEGDGADRGARYPHLGDERGRRRWAIGRRATSS